MVQLALGRVSMGKWRWSTSILDQNYFLSGVNY